jgi:hypothetical protein
MQAGAVEKHQNQLAFSESFGAYLTRCLDENPASMASLKSWREMLGRYDPTLSSLSIHEIHVILSILYYHLNRPQAGLFSLNPIYLAYLAMK